MIVEEIENPVAIQVANLEQRAKNMEQMLLFVLNNLSLQSNRDLLKPENFGEVKVGVDKMLSLIDNTRERFIKVVGNSLNS